MVTKPTLNVADIKLLKSIFATKQDISKLSSSIDRRFRQIDKRFAQVDKRFAQIDKRFDTLEAILSQTFMEYEQRIQKLEHVASPVPA